MFSPDQLVVYPAQGVGRVERIERQEIGGVGMDLYIVRILGNNITLMVPVLTAKNVGLRPLSDKKKAKNVLASLQDRSTFSGHIGQNWNRRYREYSEKLKSGDLGDVCHVLKELILISGEKELSFGERRLQEQAMALVSIELACILDKEPEDIKSLVESYFVDIMQKETEESE
ncbi:CarD family transcriptional regulator [Desulfovibrio sp. OttesenSCG-928-O18]|nr:CarD family transcriptional regulator [Desulfovibrio sp. OttesenSCG-928-O18]